MQRALPPAEHFTCGEVRGGNGVTVCYAGHPVGWLYRADRHHWSSLSVDTAPPPGHQDPRCGMR